MKNCKMVKLLKVKSIELLLLKFTTIIHKQYLPMLNTGCMMVIIKTNKKKQTWKLLQDNYSYLRVWVGWWK